MLALHVTTILKPGILHVRMTMFLLVNFIVAKQLMGGKMSLGSWFHKVQYILQGGGRAGQNSSCMAGWEAESAQLISFSSFILPGK